MSRIIIPQGESLFSNLNSYYIDIPKLIDHYKSIDFSGCIHFKSFQAEAIIYIDADEILNTLFEEKKDVLAGEEGLETLYQSAQDNNFTINIIGLDPQQIYYWANLLSAEVVYKDLNAEFTALDGLINKMATEELTGYIDVLLSGSEPNGIIFFRNGNMLPQVYRRTESEAYFSPDGPEELISKSKDVGGTFHVYRVKPKNDVLAGSISMYKDTLGMLEALLSIVEEVLSRNKKYRGQFETLLKKKFLEKTEKYPFLDPFACEITYTNQTLSSSCEASPKEMSEAVMESIAELIEELGISSQVTSRLAPWKRKFSSKIERLNVPFFS